MKDWEGTTIYFKKCIEDDLVSLFVDQILGPIQANIQDLDIDLSCNRKITDFALMHLSQRLGQFGSLKKLKLNLS
jgi:hypothetical protein